MEAELAMLVGTGATTVVGLMVTDTWDQVKQRLMGLFNRDDETAAVDRELNESRNALIAASGTPDEEGLTTDITALVRLRLRRLLEQDPDAVNEIRLLIEEFTSATGGDATCSVHNSITGGTQHGPVFQGQSFSNLNIHSSGVTAPEQ